MKHAREIQSWLLQRLAAHLTLSTEEIDVHAPLIDFGIDSMQAIRLTGELESFLEVPLDPSLLYDFPTIAELARYLGQDAPESEPLVLEPGIIQPDPVAIIGIGCRFPGASNTQAFWQLLINGVDATSEVPPARWDVRSYYHQGNAVPGKTSTRRGGFINQIEQFDPYFFGISPGEARGMDPQQRLLMEVAYEALEDAGQTKEKLSRSLTGVFVGISVNEYSSIFLNDPREIDGHAGTGNALSVAANRISYFFDLRGPSIAIDSACSSSLVAIHLACQSLRKGESHLAIAGGCNLMLTPTGFIAFSRTGLLAPDGRCKPFDERANGYARGEGAGIVVLKPLSQALHDGDLIYAVIRGSAVNQDGRTNGLMAPGSESQESVLRAAYDNAGVSPGQVQYIEAHGTGTLLGDQIEAKALGAVLGKDRTAGPCMIGSVKSNIGHLESSAGIAGVIKVALALRNKLLPPSIHCINPNPLIPFQEWNLLVQRQLTSWPRSNDLLLAGVSSFGFGGTNAHIVLEEAPRIVGDGADSDAPESYYLLPLSARTPEALRALAIAWHTFFTAQISELQNEPELGDICYTASVRRNHFEHRLAIVGTSIEHFAMQLESYVRDRAPQGNFFTGKVDPWSEKERRTTGVERQNSDRPLIEQVASAYARGDEVDWNVLYPSRGQCVSLPTYPWQRQRFWIDVANPPHRAITATHRRTLKPTHPLLGDPITLASPHKAALWQFTLSSQEHDYLQDLRIRHESIVSAAVVLEWIWTAIEQLGLERSYLLKEIELHERMIAEMGETRIVQILIYPEEQHETLSCQVFSRQEGTQEDWSLHFRCLIYPDFIDHELSVRRWSSPQSIIRRCKETTEKIVSIRAWRSKGSTMAPPCRELSVSGSVPQKRWVTSFYHHFSKKIHLAMLCIHLYLMRASRCRLPCKIPAPCPTFRLAAGK